MSRKKSCKGCRWYYFVWWIYERKCLHDDVYLKDFNCKEQGFKFHSPRWYKRINWTFVAFTGVVILIILWRM